VDCDGSDLRRRTQRVHRLLRFKGILECKRCADARREHARVGLRLLHLLLAEFALRDEGPRDACADEEHRRGDGEERRAHWEGPGRAHGWPAPPPRTLSATCKRRELKRRPLASADPRST